MRFGLVLGGTPPTSSELTLLDSCEKVICADGAAKVLLEAARPPDLIIGDLDSLDAEAYKWADALDIPIERHPADKHMTDGELALERVLEMGATSVLILGGHGGRTAMFLGNIKLLRRCHDAGVEASMNGQRESLRFLSPGSELALAGRAGHTLNLLATDDDAVVSVTGTKFNASELKLKQRSARGLSNLIVEDGASIRVHAGLVLVILEKASREK